jgi:ADP-ribosylglycohydrolase
MSAEQPQSSAAKRKALIAQLPEEKRQEIEEFQQRVEWVSQYMQTWDEGQAGAVVALMLSRIGDNMDAVPKMHQEMKTMNSLMKSMPIVAVEMQRMNANISLITANMGVMTHNMDSTMGRMGRWAPW